MTKSLDAWTMDQRWVTSTLIRSLRATRRWIPRKTCMFYTVWACNAWIGQEESFLMKFSYLSSNLNFHFKQRHIALFSRGVFQFPEDFWVNKIREENCKGPFLGWSQPHSKRDPSFADKERLFQRSFPLIFLVPVSTVCFPSIYDKDAKKYVFQGFSFQVISSCF